MIDIRSNLDRLIRDQGEDYASISKMLGRNAAYIQQFIRRGVPRKLDEDDRRLLSRYFGVDEALLGAPDSSEPRAVFANAGQGKRSGGLVLVPRLAVGASAGPGAMGGDERPHSRIGFEESWLRGVSSNPDLLSVIQVQGDSMVPTLADGDDILVDRSDVADRLRDGIYVLRIDDALNVKRLAVNPATSSLTIRSDNPAYPSWTDVHPAAVTVIGRVIWVGRKMG
jgi:phage repressor protein C with HTH and peptisase S24 domain